MRLSLLALSLLICGCEPEVTTTFVDGTVRGVSVPAASATSVAGKNLLGTSRQSVWLASGAVCSRLRTATLGQADAFGPSFVSAGDAGTRAPALLLSTDGNAFFDTGVGEERLAGSSTLRLQKISSTGTFSARFTATFTSDLGTDVVTGDFIAPPCASANPGCSASPGLLLLGALLLTRRSRVSAG